jgi:hypothetical protein
MRIPNSFEPSDSVLALILRQNLDDSGIEPPSGRQTSAARTSVGARTRVGSRPDIRGAT